MVVAVFLHFSTIAVKNSAPPWANFLFLRDQRVCSLPTAEVGGGSNEEGIISLREWFTGRESEAQ